MKPIQAQPAGPGAESREAQTGWAWAVATVGGVGLLKPGPGTWGSLAAVLWWLAAVVALHPSAAALGAGTLLASLVAGAIGIPAGTIVARESGGTDPQQVVIDEVAGQWLALAAPAFTGRADWRHALLAFGLFRLFDITKPPPARHLEKLHGGLGILLDDIAAGVFACACGLLIAHWW